MNSTHADSRQPRVLSFSHDAKECGVLRIDLHGAAYDHVGSGVLS
jgi:hypothetical protein